MSVASVNLRVGDVVRVLTGLDFEWIKIAKIVERPSDADWVWFTTVRGEHRSISKWSEVEIIRDVDGGP